MLLNMFSDPTSPFEVQYIFNWPSLLILAFLMESAVISEGACGTYLKTINSPALLFTIISMSDILIRFYQCYFQRQKLLVAMKLTFYVFKKQTTM